MLNGVVKFFKGDLSTKAMKWVGRGVATIVPAVLGLLMHEAGRCQGAIESNEEHIEFLTGLMNKLEDMKDLGE
jgi:hypothetical protein